MGDQIIARYILWQRWDSDNCWTGVALPILYSPGLFVLNLRVRLLKGGSNVMKRGKIYNHFKQPCCRASFYSDAVWCISLHRSYPFPNKHWFLRVWNTNLLKTRREKEKLLVTSNFSFFYPSVFFLFGELSAIFIKFKIVVCKLFILEEFDNLPFGKMYMLLVPG